MARKERKAVTNHIARKVPKAAANHKLVSGNEPQRIPSQELKKLAARKVRGDLILAAGAACAFTGYCAVVNRFHGDPAFDYIGGGLFLAVGGVLAGLGFIMRNSADRKGKWLPPKWRYEDVSSSPKAMKTLSSQSMQRPTVTKCRFCGAENLAGDDLCKRCGVSLKESQ